VEKRVGTAGWAAPSESVEFSEAGSHLERYASRFSCVEINSCFYRRHRRSTYARWAQSVPDDFRFAVKLSKEVTHVRRLVGVTELLETFLDDTSALGPKRGPVLVQLPPSLAFAGEIAVAFFTLLRSRYQGPIAFEPRHGSWFSNDVAHVLGDFDVAYVEADPSPAPTPASPAWKASLRYLRLHGSPQIYVSAYDETQLDAIVADMRRAAIPIWCIFDNTARAAATANALSVQDSLGGRAAGGARTRDRDIVRGGLEPFG
jgi:uncharacterized protein YecE (DUF72 family)